MYIKKRFESKNEQVGGKTTCYVDFLPDGSKKRNVLCSIEHPFNSSDLKFYPGLNWTPNLKAKAWTFASPVKADRVRSRIEMWVAQFRGNILTIDEFIENVNGIDPKNEAAPPEVNSKYRHIDDFENLIGMDISDARKEMGEWWTLAHQDVRDSRRVYDFKRSGLGEVTLTADKNNNVIRVSGRILLMPFEFSQNNQGEAAKSETAPDDAKVASPKDTQINTANAVRDFLATYLRNELEDSVDLDYAVRTYDDVYPYLEVVDKDTPDNGSYLTLYVYSPLGDGNFKIAYKYFEHPNNRIDCPTNVTGLEAVAKMFAMLVLGKSAVKESSGFDDYLAQFKEEFETQWGPYGWEKAYALILGNEEWMQELKDNWANHDYDPAEMAEFAIENWFGDDESKAEGASTYTFTWWDNAPTAERRPTTRADLKNSKHKETFTAKDDADALEQAVQFLLDANRGYHDDYDSAEEVWNDFDLDWGSGSPIPMVLKQGKRIIKDSGFDPTGDESKSESSYEKLEYEKGHKNSKGEDAPWVIRRHTDGRILASFSDKDAAEQHLARMKNYADKN